MGSTLVARRAGMQHASSATTQSKLAMPPQSALCSTASFTTAIF